MTFYGTMPEPTEYLTLDERLTALVACFALLIGMAIFGNLWLASVDREQVCLDAHDARVAQLIGEKEVLVQQIQSLTPMDSPLLGVIVKQKPKCLRYRANGKCRKWQKT